MRFTVRLIAIVTFLIAFSVAGVAASFSFTGNFVNDNDVQLFTFTLLSPGTVTFQTWSYGGGTNAAGQVIPSGGFEPTLNIFDALTGTAVVSSIDPGGTPCAPRNIDPNLLPFTVCQDAYGQVSLTAGNYILSLTQSPNGPATGNLSDGFFYTDVFPDPNFTDPTNHTGRFIDSNTFQRNGDWAVDILSVDAANEITAAPEPATAALVAAAVAIAGFRRRLTRS
jgi:hypothetical protein